MAVVAVDRSEAMIADATEEPVHAGLRFVLGDMTEVDRLALGTFGAALCIGNTLPHLTDEERLSAFAHALARLLEPGAPFLLQVLAYDRIHDQRARGRGHRPRARPRRLRRRPLRPRPLPGPGRHRPAVAEVRGTPLIPPCGCRGHAGRSSRGSSSSSGRCRP